MRKVFSTSAKCEGLQPSATPASAGMAIPKTTKKQ